MSDNFDELAQTSSRLSKMRRVSKKTYLMFFLGIVLASIGIFSMSSVTPSPLMDPELKGKLFIT